MEIRSEEGVPSGSFESILNRFGKVGHCFNNYFLFKELFFNQLTNARLAVWDNKSFKHY